MKTLVFGIAATFTLATAIIIIPGSAQARKAVYQVGYAPAYFAPAYHRHSFYSPAFDAHANYAPAYYDPAPYRGVIAAGYYGLPFYYSWQNRWRPHP